MDFLYENIKEYDHVISRKQWTTTTSYSGCCCGAWWCYISVIWRDTTLVAITQRHLSLAPRVQAHPTPAFSLVYIFPHPPAITPAQAREIANGMTEPLFGVIRTSGTRGIDQICDIMNHEHLVMVECVMWVLQQLELSIRLNIQTI